MFMIFIRIFILNVSFKCIEIFLIGIFFLIGGKFSIRTIIKSIS